MSKAKIVWRVLFLLFTKRKRIVALVKEAEDLILAVRKARSVAGDGGRSITKAELVILLDEADDVLTRTKELFV